MAEWRESIIEPEDAGQRLDRWCRKHLKIPHGLVEKWLRTGAIKVQGKKAKADQRLEAWDVVRSPKHVIAEKDAPNPVRPQDKRALQDLLLYEDKHLLIFNKPAGLAVQGGSGVKLSIDSMLDSWGGKEKPKLVHRIDRDTSGVLAVAKTGMAARTLSAAFHDHKLEKIYRAIVIGVPAPRQGKIDKPLAKGEDGDREKMLVRQGGQRSISHYRVLDHATKTAALVELEPLTGRTHQLRVHMASIGHPILGDGKYGGQTAFIEREQFLHQEGFAKQLHLHAYRLRFALEGLGKVDVTAPLPKHMVQTMDVLGLNDVG